MGKKLDKIYYWDVWIIIMLQYPLWWVAFKINNFHTTHLFRYMYCTYDMEIKARESWERFFPTIA